MKNMRHQVFLFQRFVISRRILRGDRKGSRKKICHANKHCYRETGEVGNANSSSCSSAFVSSLKAIKFTLFQTNPIDEFLHSLLFLLRKKSLKTLKAVKPNRLWRKLRQEFEKSRLNIYKHLCVSRGLRRKWRLHVLYIVMSVYFSEKKQPR